MASNATRSITALTATLAATGIHHIFRLGLALVIPTALLIGIGLSLWLLYGRTRRTGFLVGYGVFTALMVIWFGLLDGFLDHVVKAFGFDNVTFLPGSESEAVATAMQLWSQQASTLFYEATGILSAVLALTTTIATAAYLRTELQGRSATAN